MKTFLGKKVRAYSEPSWKFVPSSKKQIKKTVLKEVRAIEVRYSEEHEHLYAAVLLGTIYVAWQLDSEFKGRKGDTIDPSSFIVFQLTNGRETITRCTGRVIQHQRDQ